LPCLGNCKFAMRHIPGFNPIVRTDVNGKSCRGDVLLPSCAGACKTQEYGTHVFPYRESITVACTLLGNEVRNITLNDCDEGADSSIRTLKVSASTTCGCRELPPKS